MISNKIKYKHFCKKNISNIGYGCATLAELYNNFESNEYLDILEFSYKNGINYYDVAPFYGGEIAEKRLGEFIKKINNREDIFIATKIGRYTSKNSLSGAGGYFDFTPKKIEESIKKSLENLNISYIDLIQCHDIEYVELKKIIDILPLLEHYKSIGLINGIGINSYPIQPLKNIIENTKIKIDSVGTYAHNTIINNTIIDHIDYFKNKDIEIINSSPLAMGLLTEKGPPSWHPASKLMLNKVSELNLYCKNNKENISDLSMKYSLSNDNILTTITGGKNINEIHKNINCLNKPLSNFLIKDINKILYPIKNCLWGPEDGVNPVFNWNFK